MRSEESKYGNKYFHEYCRRKVEMLNPLFSESKTNEDKRVLYSNTGHYPESFDRPIKAVGKRWACPKRSI
jgi:hypothetical protein